MEIANIVASGEFDEELDLATIAEEAGLETHPGISSTEHSQSQGSRLLVRFDDSTLGIITSSGVYMFTGVKSHESLDENLNHLMNALSNSSVVRNAEPTNFSIRNVVCVEDLEQKIDLSELSLLLGVNQVEYEPEQFPGLVYRLEEPSSVLLIFATGKIVVTGVQDLETADKAVSKFIEGQEQLS